jgi:hypothetical protein
MALGWLTPAILLERRSSRCLRIGAGRRVVRVQEDANDVAFLTAVGARDHPVDKRALAEFVSLPATETDDAPDVTRNASDDAVARDAINRNEHLLDDTACVPETSGHKERMMRGESGQKALFGGRIRDSGFDDIRFHCADSSIPLTQRASGEWLILWRVGCNLDWALRTEGSGRASRNKANE